MTEVRRRIRRQPMSIARLGISPAPAFLTPPPFLIALLPDGGNFSASARDKLLLTIPRFLKRGLCPFLGWAQRDRSLNGYAELRRKRVREASANDEHCCGFSLSFCAAERRRRSQTKGPSRSIAKVSDGVARRWSTQPNARPSEMTRRDLRVQGGCKSC